MVSDLKYRQRMHRVFLFDLPGAFAEHTVIMKMPKLTLFFKGLVLDSFSLTESLIIGRNPNCAIHIDSLSIAPKHAEVFLENGKWAIRSISDTKKTLINHTAVSQQHLRHGDHLQIGKYTLSFCEDATQPAYTPATPLPTQQVIKQSSPQFEHIVDSIKQLPEGCMQILNGPHVGKIIPLQKSLTRLGLDGNQCAMIAHRGEGYFISHLEGDTPPKVNHTSIENSSMRLEDKQIIELGKTRMRFYEEILQPVAISSSA